MPEQLPPFPSRQGPAQDPTATVRTGAHETTYPEVPWSAAALLHVPTPSRVAFAGCWHHRSDLAPAAIAAASKAGAQVIIHTGDFLYTSPAADKMLHAVEEAASAHGLFLVVVRGNHDNPHLFRKAVASTRRRNKGLDAGGVSDGFARLSPHVLHAPNGHRWTWNGVEFVALGGAHSVDRPALTEGVSYWRDEVASPREINQVKRGGHAQVMITHDVPAGHHLPLPSVGPSWWDLAGAERHHAAVRSAVDAVRPDWVIGGHMHMRFSDSLFLSPTPDQEFPHQVRVEVLDKIESGLPGNLLVADLREGHVIPR